jgi:hypothetical protein
MLTTLARTLLRRHRWRDRAARLQAIDPLRPRESDKAWAIAALRDEARSLRRHLERSREPLAEEYGVYSVSLALFVARLRDARAIESLALVTEIAPAVPRALVEFGDAAVDPVIRSLKVPSLRRSAAWTLRALLGSGRLSSAKAVAVARALAQ